MAEPEAAALREVYVPNRHDVAIASEQIRPTVHRLVIAVEDGDPDAARRIAGEVPAEFRDEVSKTCRWMSWPHEGGERAGGAIATREDDARCEKALFFAMLELTDDMQHLVDACFRRQGSPGPSAEALADELELRPAAWRRSFARELERYKSGRIWLLHRTLADRGLLAPPGDISPLAVLDIPWNTLPAVRAQYSAVGDWLDALWTEHRAGRTPARLLSFGMPHVRPIPKHDSNFPDSWWSGLLEAWGAYDPDRRGSVLDACLGALGGAAGDSQADLRGWVQVHGRLAPTQAERAERQSRYLNIAASAATGPAKLARAVVSGLRVAGVLDSEALLDVSPECLLRKEKSAVKEWLQILTSCVAAGELASSEVAAVVAEARPHLPRGTEGTADALLDACGVRIPTSVDEPRWMLPLPVDLPPPGRVEPVASMDELVELLLALGEKPDPIEVERAIDGVLRFRDPSPTIAAHLPRGIADAPGLGTLLATWSGRQAKIEPFGARRVHRNVARIEDVPKGVTARRLDDPHLLQGQGPRWAWFWDVPVWTPNDLIGKRLTEALYLVTHAPAPSLTLPVTTQGGIDADTIVARVGARRAAGLGPYLHESAAALLRLDPGDRPAVLSDTFTGPRAARWLDLLETPRSFIYGPVTPGGREVTYVHPGQVAAWREDDSARPRDTDDPVSLWIDTSDTINHWGSYAHPRYSQYGRADGSAWVAQLPWHLDVAAVHLMPQMISNTEDVNEDPSEAISQFQRARMPLGPQAVDALTWGATHLDTRTRTAAGETLAALARTGLVSADVLTGSVLRLVGPGAGPFLIVPPKLSRIASTLKDCTRINEHAERLVLDAVIGCLASLKDMRGGVALLEIAAEIAERRGIRVDLPEPLAGVAAGRSSTRLAEEARRLSGAPRPHATPYRPLHS